MPRPSRALTLALLIASLLFVQQLATVHAFAHAGGGAAAGVPAGDGDDGPCTLCLALPGPAVPVHRTLAASAQTLGAPPAVPAPGQPARAADAYTARAPPAA